MRPNDRSDDVRILGAVSAGGGEFSASPTLRWVVRGELARPSPPSVAHPVKPQMCRVGVEVVVVDPAADPMSASSLHPSHGRVSSVGDVLSAVRRVPAYHGLSRRKIGFCTG